MGLANVEKIVTVSSSDFVEQAPQRRPATAFHVEGTFHPRAGGWRFNGPIMLNFDQQAMELTVKDGTFAAEVTGPTHLEPSEWLGRVRMFIQSCADALGFNVGASIQIEVTAGHVVHPDSGIKIPFELVYEWSAITGRDPGTQVDAAAMDPYMFAAIENEHLREALGDLGMALSRPLDSHFYGYRAVESIRQWLNDRDAITGGEAISWGHLRATLGFTETDLKALATASRARRHGAVQSVTEAQRLETIRLAREVVQRAVAEFMGARVQGDAG